MNKIDIEVLQNEYCLYADRYFKFCKKDFDLEPPFTCVFDDINHCMSIVDNKGKSVNYTLEEIYQSEIDKNRMISLNDKLRKYYDDLYYKVSTERGWI